MVFSVEFITSYCHWTGIVRIDGRIGLSKFFSNLSVCYVHCSCGTWDRHETCVRRSNFTTLVAWMVFVCRDASDAIKPTPSIVAREQPKSRTMCVKWLARSKEGATIHAVWVLVHDHRAAGVKESSSHWLENQSSDAQAWPGPSSSDASVGESPDWILKASLFFLFGPCLLPFVLVDLLACTIV